MSISIEKSLAMVFCNLLGLILDSVGAIVVDPNRVTEKGQKS